MTRLALRGIRVMSYYCCMRHYICIYGDVWKQWNLAIARWLLEKDKAFSKFIISIGLYKLKYTLLYWSINTIRLSICTCVRFVSTLLTDRVRMATRIEIVVIKFYYLTNLSVVLFGLFLSHTRTKTRYNYHIYSVLSFGHGDIFEIGAKVCSIILRMV